MEERNREPVSPGTIEDMERALRLWLNPYLGGLPLAEVNNGALKKVVAILVDAGKSAKTVSTYAGIAKTVVASALNKEGEQLYPRKWNSEFIDLPLVKKSEQNAPSFSSEVMTGLAAWKHKRERTLFTLCGATGPRVGEALGIEIDKHISADFKTIKVRQKFRHGKIEGRLKTEDSLRDLDVNSAVAEVIKEFAGDRKSGFLFCTKNGKPLELSNVLRRHLHPALKQLGYVNPHTGDHKAGSHAFRRYRETHLDNFTECPPGLVKYWMGHTEKTMSDRYNKIKRNVNFRKEQAEKCGIGFELPSVVPNVPKNAVKIKVAKAL
jgi:integrase